MYQSIRPQLHDWIVVLCTMYSVSTILLVIRLYDRLSRGHFRWADRISGIMLILLTLYFTASVALWQAKTLSELANTFIFAPHLIVYFYEVLRTIVVPITKISVIMLLFEIEPIGMQRRCLQGLLGFVFFQVAITGIMSMFGCVFEQDAVWAILGASKLQMDSESGRTLQKCIKFSRVFLLSAIMNSCTEIAIVGLALLLVWRVKATRSQKWGLSISFLLGFFTISASIISSFHLFTAYKNVQIVRLRPYADRQFVLGHTWAAVEIYLGAIIASLLPIRALLQNTMMHLSGSLCALLTHLRGLLDVANLDMANTIDSSSRIGDKTSHDVVEIEMIEKTLADQRRQKHQDIYEALQRAAYL